MLSIGRMDEGWVLQLEAWLVQKFPDLLKG
jgi:hypothetical protein